MTVEVAARRIIRGIEREQFLVYTHGWTRLLVLARAIAPQTFSRLWNRVNAIDEERHRIASTGGLNSLLPFQLDGLRKMI